jgi:hypothetical protein
MIFLMLLTNNKENDETNIDSIPLDTEFECKFFYCFLFFIMT